MGLLQVSQTLQGDVRPDVWLTLPFGQRCKSRLRVRLSDGREAALRLPRGTVLRGGSFLESDDGTVIGVRAAEEDVSTAHSGDRLALARICYHLGNRHVPLQIGSGWVRYAHDHVLDEMVRGLGVEVVREEACFEPEAGAYPADGAAHGGKDHHHR